jgi:hypothetical protein
MTACCGRRREDGILDSVAVSRAMDGRQTDLSPSEARVTIWRLTCQRRWGPQQIADHLGYSKARICGVLKEIRDQGARV